MKKTILKQAGFTLIEILLVVGFIALAGIGIYYIYNKVKTENMIDEEARSEKRIFSDIQPFIANSSTGFSIDTAFLSDSHIISKSQVDSKNPELFTNRLGSNTMVSSVFREGDSRLIAIQFQYPHMSSQYCARLINIYAPDAAYISVKNTIIKNDLDSQNIITYDFANAVKTCTPQEKEADDFNITVAFKRQ